MRRILHLLSIAALTTSLQAPLAAVDIWVTRYDDPVPNGCLPTDCSLREAVIAANADPDFDVIRLSAGDYLLTLAGTGEDAAADGDLDLLESVDVVGLAPALTRLVGDGLGEP
ncbi:MAG TPA: hypothetical protein VI942_13375, partial [Thermoanaerobaculia bacterium]|nr:hypothetical protein [Thermoanaerobaculia bacterium]